MRVARDTATLLHMKTTEVTAATAMNLARQDPAESSRKSTPRDDRDKNSGLDWPYFLRSKKKTTDLTI